MLKILMEFRKGILFVRLYGNFKDGDVLKFESDVKEVIVTSGIKYVVLNIENLDEISKEAIKEIKSLKKILKNSNGQLFLSGGSIKELSSLVTLENELNVFRKVVI